MEASVRKQLERALAEVDDHGTHGPRLREDAQRLFARTRKLATLSTLKTPPDFNAIELACYALQLRHRQSKRSAAKPARPNLKARAEASAELLLTIIEDDASAATNALIDRATQLLSELPLRNPTTDDARLLADAVNLDDFGVSGLMQIFVPLVLHGMSVPGLIDALEKRDQYGYWDARLKDTFHFEAARALAKRRLAQARIVTAQLVAESNEDQP